MSSDCDPTAIILCSSSENAMRTIRTLRDLTSESGICAGIALEGKDYGSQCNKLRHSDILVGTIGRLLQITPNLGIQGVKMLVVDDAHQILDASLLERLEALKTEGALHALNCITILTVYRCDWRENKVFIRVKLLYRKLGKKRGVVPSGLPATAALPQPRSSHNSQDSAAKIVFQVCAEWLPRLQHHSHDCCPYSRQHRHLRKHQ